MVLGGWRIMIIMMMMMIMIILGSDGPLVGVVSGGQRLRAKRIQHSGLSFRLSSTIYLPLASARNSF